MFTITVSFKPNASNAEVIAQVIKLLAELENSGVTEPNPETGGNPGGTEVKPVKTRKARVNSEEQKAAFRARMVAAREAKKAADKPSEPVKVGVKLVESVKVNGSKKLIKSNKVSMMPRTGQKVGPKPAAQ